MELGALRRPADDFHNAAARRVASGGVAHRGRLIREPPSLSNANVDHAETLRHTQTVRQAS